MIFFWRRDHVWKSESPPKNPRPAPPRKDGSEPEAFWKDIVPGCRVIVGLHPDQATGGIVTLARAFRRPFAVVPCCTFADDFPERRLADGRAVRTYDDLVQWLRAHGNAEVDFLRFQGMNQVVYDPPARDSA
ncbi:unnamed protein product [Prorocentrum cordatum]|uniref:Uncharacterized protein n=1 Tax=Prorocentrum cordatum TaxID=2364126 RepID=A0ABN9QA39_9DINO|nr:unnamed protein product [Polarella glacialis]